MYGCTRMLVLECWVVWVSLERVEVVWCFGVLEGAKWFCVELDTAMTCPNLARKHL